MQFLEPNYKKSAKLHCKPKFKGSNYHLNKNLTKFDEVKFFLKTNVERKAPQSALVVHRTGQIEVRPNRNFTEPVKKSARARKEIEN